MEGWRERGAWRKRGGGVEGWRGRLRGRGGRVEGKMEGQRGRGGGGRGLEGEGLTFVLGLEAYFPRSTGD